MGRAPPAMLDVPADPGRSAVRLPIGRRSASAIYGPAASTCRLSSPRRILRAAMMSSQYIFTMHRLSKLHPPNKTVLDDVTLDFYPGAKIGVLGYNGAGKSTLLRIMAGGDPEYRGEGALAPGASGGRLAHEA